MRSFFTLWRREIAALFLSPIAYVMLMFFLLVTGCGFYWQMKLDHELIRSIQGLMFTIWGCMLIVIPILTMRAFAEERKNGTFETLMTAPVQGSTVTTAKFAGALSFFILMCAPTALYMVVIQQMAPDAAELIDLGALLGGYLMVVLIAGAFIAVGLLASALTSNQIIAAISTFAVMSTLFFGGLFEPHLAQSPLVREIGGYLSPALHLVEAGRGVFDSRPLAFYFSSTVFLLFVTNKAISTRR